MDRPLTSLLCCPDDRSPLRLRSQRLGPEGAVEEGVLECGACGESFCIREGIALLLPRPLRSGAAGGPDGSWDQMRSEMAVRDEESTLYDALYDDSAFRFEIETYVRQLDVKRGECILDVGCGTGRITKEYIAGAGAVVGADLSFDSLRLLRSRLGAELRGRLLAVCCEVGHLPLPDDAFDAVVSTSLFSNVPTRATRDAGLAEVERVLKPGGRFLVTVYNHCRLKRIRQALGLSRSGHKQGVHSQGRVHYYNFDPREFTEWVAARFQPGPVFGLNHRVPLLSRASTALAERLDRFLFRVPHSLEILAKEMGMVARKPLSRTP